MEGVEDREGELRLPHSKTILCLVCISRTVDVKIFCCGRSSLNPTSSSPYVSAPRLGACPRHVSRFCMAHDTIKRFLPHPRLIDSHRTDNPVNDDYLRG